MSSHPVVKRVACCLAHVPDLVRYGSKPRREIQRDPALEGAIGRSLRRFADAVRYPPNQVFIGNARPEALSEIPRPWYAMGGTGSEESDSCRGAFGEIFTQEAFCAHLWRADVMEPPLFWATERGAERFRRELEEHGLFAVKNSPGSTDAEMEADSDLRREIAEGKALRVASGDFLHGWFRRDNRSEGREDENLSASILLENLCAKASGAMALQTLLRREKMAAEDVDYVIGCGEEACGDRYQRGGGGMAKAIAEMCGCVSASGMDVKNFCAGPASAIVTAGAMVKAGLYERVAVVGGGSLAKLGMKFRAFLEKGMPVLDDCLASMAILVTRDDGVSPFLRIEAGAIGKATVGASTSDEAVYRQLVLEPLARLKLTMKDIDKFAPELHNPEIMDLAGSGDVARKNYRALAAMAVLGGEIEKAEMNGFIERIGMPGFAPTQGHIPSAAPYLGHALAAMKRGEMRRALFLGKASLFLNRCTQLYDGVSFLLEAR